MKFLYPISAIQAGAFNVESESRSNVALGLEILDNTLDIPQKTSVLSILDRRSPEEKMACLEEWVPYQPMSPSDRLRRLIEFRHFLPDWSLACCFHLAKNRSLQFDTGSHSRLPASSYRFCPGSRFGLFERSLASCLS
jgi:hypothetical protein